MYRQLCRLFSGFSTGTLPGLCLLFAMLLVGQTNASPRAADLPPHCPEPLTVVFYGDWYPFMFAKEGGYRGLDFEFLEQVLNRIGCRVRVETVGEKRGHRNMAQGHRLIMSGATYTEQRARYAYFSESYRQEVISVFYLRSLLNGQPASLEAIVANSDAIAINAAGWYGDAVEVQRKGPHKDKFIHVAGLLRRVQMLQRQRTQALIEDHIAGCNQLKNDAPQLLKHVSSLPVSKTTVAFMFSKQVVNRQFIHLFNRTMAKLMADGSYDALHSRYLGEDCS